MGAPLALGRDGGLQPFLIRHVYDVQRRVHRFGPVYGAFIRFGFHKFGPRQVVVPCRGFALFEEVRNVHINDIGVFGVQVRHAADFLGFKQHLDERSVVHHHAFFFIHEETFEACDAVVRGGFKFVQQRIFIQIRNAAVERIVHAGVGIAQFLACFHGFDNTRALALHRVIKHSGYAAAGCRARAGQIAVRRNRAAERHLQMRVHIDRARKHQQAVRVHHLVRRHVKRRSDQRDFFRFPRRYPP